MIESGKLLCDRLSEIDRLASREDRYSVRIPLTDVRNRRFSHYTRRSSRPTGYLSIFRSRIGASALSGTFRHRDTVAVDSNFERFSRGFELEVKTQHSPYLVFTIAYGSPEVPDIILLIENLKTIEDRSEGIAATEIRTVYFTPYEDITRPQRANRPRDYRSPGANERSRLRDETGDGRRVAADRRRSRGGHRLGRGRRLLRRRRSEGDPRRASIRVKDRTASGLLHAEIRKPTIATIEGHCVAGGMEVMFRCDLCLAASDATFSARSSARRSDSRG